jgi:hypothetical protein
MSPALENEPVHGREMADRIHTWVCSRRASAAWWYPGGVK